jgi:acetyl-CoA C-acetyltransferase
MARKVAIVGTGQTKGVRKRDDVNLAGLVAEAVNLALADAGMDASQIDAVVLGSAPEIFEGVNFPECWLGPAIGALDKPILRVYTGGTVGASTGIAAYYHVASGLYDTVLAVAFEKLSDGVPMYGLSVTYDPLWGREIAAGAAGLVALQAHQYLARYPHISIEHLAKAALNDRTNALCNPNAHIRVKLTLDEILSSPMITSPLTLHMCCPTTDGAAALVLAPAAQAKKHRKKPAYIRSVSTCAEGAYYPGMDIAAPMSLKLAGQRAFQRAGIRNPVEQLDVVELYSPFAPHNLIWGECLQLALPGEGWRLVEDSFCGLNGKLPINPSGGVIAHNPIGASGLIRQIEAARQIMGVAGEFQVKRPQLALAHAWGGWVQFHNVMILSAET